MKTETATCPTCLHEVLVIRTPDGTPKMKGHRDPDDQYRRECGGGGRVIPETRVMLAAWCEA